MRIDMNEKYKLIQNGWLYQENVTGKLMKYDTSYIEKFNQYNTSLLLSKIRYDYCIEYTNFKSVLDVGYGNGAFLNYCIDNEIYAYGNDISGYPIPKNANFIEDIHSINVDLVTFFDCIEHFQTKEINEVLNKLNTKFVCISVPWCHDIDNMIAFEHWKHRKPNEHFHHFNLEGICNLLHSSNFKFVTCGSPEDAVRKNNGKQPNILTIIGKR